MTHAWLEPFREKEKARCVAPGRQKYGGPDPSELGIKLGKPNSNNPRSHAGCVFYDAQHNDCLAALVTKNLDVHNGCFSSGKVWIRVDTSELHSSHQDDEKS